MSKKVINEKIVTSINVNQELYREFKAICSRKGLKISEVFERFMKFEVQKEVVEKVENQVGIDEESPW